MTESNTVHELELEDDTSKPPKTEIPEIEAGDHRDIDTYMKKLSQLDIEADYQNIHANTGFIAKVKVEDTLHAIWEGDVSGQMVKTVEKGLKEILSDNKEEKQVFKFQHESVKTGCCNYKHRTSFWMAENRKIARLRLSRETIDRKPNHGICGTCMSQMIADNELEITGGEE